MHFSFTESKSLPKSRLCVQTLNTNRESAAKGTEPSVGGLQATGTTESLATLDQMSYRVSSS